ncbi:hypothetical protein [Aquimonas sp.]|jgi:hypothetical protein|uniref:hypothetical protein n=1 Tax=Aquimonas sp. TaxID=1872588 RepID=UPI0037C0CC8F
MRPLPTLTFTLVTLVSLAGCTSQQWYSASRPALQERCLRHTIEAQYRACMASASLDYTSYRRRQTNVDTPTNLRD